MDWNNILQEIVDYVEEHLQCTEERIMKEEIARIAGCSFDFFQKVFSYMMKISLSEYIRFRKMTLAGYDLKSTHQKVIDISYKYGYLSPTSFTKTFQQFHGVTPTHARNKDVSLKVYPKMKVNLDKEYTWRLVKKPAIRLIGKSNMISTIDRQHAKKIPEFWSICQQDGTFLKLLHRDEANVKGMFGLFLNQDHNNEIEYALMVESYHDLIEGFKEVILPEMTWAVFDCVGIPPMSIQEGWRYLEEEWLLEYPFKHAKAPELEWYSSGNMYDKDYLSQIWIPIIEEEV